VIRRSPEWFPDWTGETVIIVASGPSAGGVDLESVRGRLRAIAVNTSWKLAPWADALYACDYAWWKSENGCPEFAGLKITVDARAAGEWSDIRKADIRRGDDRMILNEPGTVGWGGNSGFHALNLAAQFGAGRVLLVGFDMSIGHWHGKHPTGMNNPREVTLARWRRALDRAAPVLKAAGIEVINCSMASALTAYPKMKFEEACR